MKPDEAHSAAQRGAVNAWFSNTLLGRLNDKRDGRIVVTMQRLHEDDLAGRLARRGGWEALRPPALAEAGEEHRFSGVLGPRRFRRRAGEALHPAREPLGTPAEVRRALGEHNSAGQHQQAPAPLEGGVAKRARLRFYDPRDLPEAFGLVLRSWDTANKPTELSDHSVCTTRGAKGGHLWLPHVLRERLDYPGLKRAVLAQAATRRAGTVGSILLKKGGVGFRLRLPAPRRVAVRAARLSARRG